MVKIIIGISGEISSGKGTLTKYIVDKYAGSSYRFSTMLRDLLSRLYLEHTRENMQKISTILRQNFSEDIMAKVMMEDVKKDTHSVIVVEGVRRLADIKYLKKLPGFKFAFIDASMEKRYERIIRRRENPDDANKTFEQFKKDHEQEAESQIKELKNHADYIIDNDGGIQALYKQIDDIINKLQ